jgi:hypothetical protein
MFAANLDSDRALERVVQLKGEGLSVAIEDPRGTGRSCVERVTGGFEGRIPSARVVEATGAPPRELLYQGDWGANRVGEFGLVFVVGRNDRPGKCLHISRPFRYIDWRVCPTFCGWSPELAPPRGFVVGTFRVQLRELDQTSRGREIVLTEYYIRPERKTEGATRRRITRFGCCRGGRYRPYETRVEQLP